MLSLVKVLTVEERVDFVDPAGHLKPLLESVQLILSPSPLSNAAVPSIEVCWFRRTWRGAMRSTRSEWVGSADRYHDYTGAKGTVREGSRRTSR